MKIFYNLLSVAYWFLRKFFAFWLGAFFVIFFFVFLLVWDRSTSTPENCAGMPGEMAHYLIEQRIKRSDGFPHEIPTYISDGYYNDAAHMWVYDFTFPSESHRIVSALIGCDTSIEFSFENIK